MFQIYKYMFSKLAYDVFEKSINDYHVNDSVDQPINNPFAKDKFEHLLYHKNYFSLTMNQTKQFNPFLVETATCEFTIAALYHYSCFASIDRKSTRLNSSHVSQSRMPSSA